MVTKAIAMPKSTSKITKRAVDGAAPKAGRYIVWDSELKGFGLRVAESGTKTYFVRYRPRGLGRGAPKRFVVLGRHGVITPDEARNRARAILGAVAAGQDPAKGRADSDGAIAIASLVDRFINEHVKPKRKDRTASGYAATLNSYVVPRFGKRDADRVSAAEIAQLHHAMRDRPYQANRMLAIVGSMYGFAARRGLVAKGTNPADGIERYRESARERYLNADELSRLGQAVHLAETVGLPWGARSQAHRSKHLAKEENQRTLFAPHLTLAFRLLLLTGARLREILNLEWRYVDLEHGLLLLPDNKTGRKTIERGGSSIAWSLRAHRRFRDTGRERG